MRSFFITSMAFLFAMLVSCQKESDQYENEDPKDEQTEPSEKEQKIAPQVIDYSPGFSQFIAERFPAALTRKEILEECTKILAKDSSDITLGGLGGYLTVDLGSEQREQDYYFRFKGNGFDDTYCQIYASEDGISWKSLTGDESQLVELSYIQNTSHTFYSWVADTSKNCRTIGKKEICTTKITYQWDTTAIWTKIVNGIASDIKPNSGNTPLVYVRAHRGPYFHPLLERPSGKVPYTTHTLPDTFVVTKEIRYLKFQNAFDSISPITGEFSPEISGISILFQ